MNWTEEFKRLSLTETVAVSLSETEEEYVLDIAAQSGVAGDYLAVTSSKHTIRLYSRHNLAATGEIKGHTDVISGICWGKTEPNLLYSAAKDKTIRCWDIRTKPAKEVQKYEGSDETKNVFTCLDVNASDLVVCAGQELDREKNAFIFFWERRTGDLLGAYSESHRDDITQVCFHPSNADSLATGSTDGLVCLFDISQTDEDDAACYTLNSCSTVAKVGWCGDGWNNVYCTTHIDTVHVWDSEEGDPVVEVTDLKEVLQGSDSVEYIVDCLASDSDLHLLAGTHSGDLRIVELSGKGTPRVLSSLPGGHKSTVRCLHWDAKSKSLVTGGEDAMLCLWSTQSRTVSTDKSKLKAKKSISSRHNPY